MKISDEYEKDKYKILFFFISSILLKQLLDASAIAASANIIYFNLLNKRANVDTTWMIGLDDFIDGMESR